MLEVEVLGARRIASGKPSLPEVRRLARAAAAAAGVGDGHVAIEFVDAPRIAKLNREHRAQSTPTDVLSFPIDGVEPRAQRPPGEAPAPAAGPPAQAPPRELGDVVICPEHTADLREAIVHGMLHLLGMDHESDSGEMLALQRLLLAPGRPARARPGSAGGRR